MRPRHVTQIVVATNTPLSLPYPLQPPKTCTHMLHIVRAFIILNDCPRGDQQLTTRVLTACGPADHNINQHHHTRHRHHANDALPRRSVGMRCASVRQSVARARARVRPLLPPHECPQARVTQSYNVNVVAPAERPPAHVLELIYISHFVGWSMATSMFAYLRTSYEHFRCSPVVCMFESCCPNI